MKLSAISSFKLIKRFFYCKILLSTSYFTQLRAIDFYFFNKKHLKI
jgi:hypothetical protein